MSRLQLFTAAAVLLAVALMPSARALQPDLAATDTPACANIRLNYGFTTWAQSAACIHSIPLNVTNKMQTINALKGMVTQMYVFTDLARKSPEPRFPIAVDILGELQTIANTVQPDEYTFHQQLLVSFNKLLDAHTPYIKPAIFNRFVWRIGYTVEYRVDASHPNGAFFLYYAQPAATLAFIYANVTGAALFPSTSIDGWELTAVNGVNAYDYFTNWASNPALGNVGNVKDNGTLFEVALHGSDRNPVQGMYAFRIGVICALPEEATNGTVIFSVKHGAQTMDWSTQFVAQANSVADAHAAVANTDAEADAEEPAAPNADPYTAAVARLRAAIERNEVAAHAVPQRLMRRIALRSRHALHYIDPTKAPRSLREVELNGWHQPSPGVWKPKTEKQIATELGVPHHLLAALDTDRADPMFGPPLTAPKPVGERVRLGQSIPVDPYTGVGYIDLNGDNSVGILQVTTFAPRGNQNQQFANQIADILALKPTKLVVDLTGNGGGNIALGYGLLKLLFPQITDRNIELFGATDWVRSDLNLAFAQSTMQMIASNPFNLTGLEVWAPWAWAPATAPYPQADDVVGGYRGFYNDSRWLTQGSTRVRNGVTSQWSQVVRDGGLMKNAFDIWVTPNVIPTWNPQDIAILSNGFCGSTCALFSSFVQLHGLAKSITLGGVVSQSQQFWAFPGLQVFELSIIGLIANFFGLQSNPAVPPQFPTGSGAVTQVCIREIFEWSDAAFDVPTEYRFVPSTYHLAYNSRLNDTNAQYAQVSTILYACDPNPTYDLRCFNRDPLTGGDGKQYCTGNGLSPCVLSSCAMRGYALNSFNNQLPTSCVTCPPGQALDSTGACVACPAGTFRAQDMDPTQCVACFNAMAYGGSDKVTYTSAAGQADPNCAFSTSASGLSAKGKLALTGVFCFIGGGLVIGGLMWWCLVRNKRSNSGESAALAGGSNYDRMH